MIEDFMIGSFGQATSGEPRPTVDDIQRSRTRKYLRCPEPLEVRFLTDTAANTTKCFTPYAFVRDAIDALP
jgi:hypothetical protein